MKKKKGISFEEKRQRLLSIFTNDPSFYHMKELEKLGQKKGIHPMIVKEVLDSLIGDNLVDMEKVGSSSYYLALPSKTILNKQINLQKFSTNIEYICFNTKQFGQGNRENGRKNSCGKQT
jgi:hypothetical protein